MRLKYHRLIRPFALTVTAATLAMAVVLVWGTGVGLAADFQEGKGNVCEGNLAPAWCNWVSHVTGSDNVALGAEMMPKLTSGSNNVALDLGALAADTSGSDNVAIGVEALNKNSTGSENAAFGFHAGRNVILGNNIDIANEGTAGDIGTIRIGTQGPQTRAFMAGIYNVGYGSRV